LTSAAPATQLADGLGCQQERAVAAVALTPAGCGPQVALSWEVAQPFEVVPASAVLQAGAAAPFELRFAPGEAASFAAAACCRLESGQRYHVQVG
jgi:hypothetical protein